MFNDGELGGLCILRGCMPTKTMLHAAHLVHEPRCERTRAIERLVGKVHAQRATTPDSLH